MQPKKVTDMSYKEIYYTQTSGLTSFDFYLNDQNKYKLRIHYHLYDKINSGNYKGTISQELHDVFTELTKQMRP